MHAEAEANLVSQDGERCEKMSLFDDQGMRTIWAFQYLFIVLLLIQL